MTDRIKIIGSIVVLFLFGFFFVQIDSSGDVTISGRKSIQLETIKFPTPTKSSTPRITVTIPPVTNLPPAQPPQNACGSANAIMLGTNPTTGACCVLHGGATGTGACCPGVPAYPVNNPNVPWPAWCGEKPVIYLYPEKPTLVDVKVTVPGKITVSIPEYKDGWKSVLAHPDGTLIYEGKKYTELFYETNQRKANPPTGGIIVKRAELKQTLTDMTTRLGLNTNEQNDFLLYWLPRLSEVEGKYFLISFFAGAEKQPVDKVDITPKPDVFIEFIMYFKPINKPFEIAAPIYPEVPERTGFTAVEWGGIVDY